MIELQLKPSSTRRVIDAIEQRGPGRTNSVNLKEAWIGTHSEVFFASVESANESLVRDAGCAWVEVGECLPNPVVDIGQF